MVSFVDAVVAPVMAYLNMSVSNTTDPCSEGCGNVLTNTSILCVDPKLYSNHTESCMEQNDDPGFFGFSYLLFLHCTVHGSAGVLLLLALWLFVLLMALGSTADNFLMPQLHYLSELLRLSPDVAGVTLLAIGNGAPDVVRCAPPPANAPRALHAQAHAWPTATLQQLATRACTPPPVLGDRGR
jgi:hypothetical protein